MLSCSYTLIIWGVPIIRQWFVLERVVGMLLLPAARIRLAIPVSPKVLLCDNVANGGPLAIGPLAVGSRWWR